MAWLDPEKIMTGLMKSMGVSTQDFIDFIVMAQREFAEMRADRLAFKPASIKAYQELTGRLDRLEMKIDAIASVMAIQAPTQTRILQDEQHDSNGHGH